MEYITSRRNPLCLRLRRLAASASLRREQGAFVGESPKLLEEALRWAPHTLRTVVSVPEVCLPPLPPQVRQVQVPRDVMASLSAMEAPQGVLFAGVIPDAPWPQALPPGRYVVLDAMQDPGNVGTVLRTADAFGAGGVFLLGGCADAYHPRTLRSAMGAVFRLPVWRSEPGPLAQLLEKSGLPLYGAALGAGAADLRRADLRRCAIAIGSEGRGLGAETLALCRGLLRIPMAPRCESLNAAAAAAVLLWESARQDQQWT